MKQSVAMAFALLFYALDFKLAAAICFWLALDA